MKRQLPFVLVFLFGMFMLFQYFVPHESSEWVYEFLLDWIVIIGIFALALGIWSLFKVSVDRIKTRRPNWFYSYVTLAGLFLMVAFGFTGKDEESWGLYWVFMLLLVAVIWAFMQVQIAANAAQKRGYFGLGLLLLAGAILIGIYDPNWSFYFYTQEGLENTMFVSFFNYVLLPILSTMFALLAFFIASAAYRAFRARNVLATLLLIAALIVMMRFNPWVPYAPYWAKASNWLMNVPNLAAQRAIVIGIGLGAVSTAIKVMLGIERGYMGRG